MMLRRTFLLLCCTAATLAASARADAREPDQVTAAALAGKRPHAGDAPQLLGKSPILVNPGKSGLAGIDSLVNFTGQYTYPGFDWQGNPQSVWPWAMVGRSPRSNATTVIGAPVIPVSIDMRNADGSPRYVNGQRLYMDANKFVWPVLNSPIFRPLKWATSLIPTQYLDALFRAQFWRGAGDGDFDRGDHISEAWHTLLLPVPRTPRVMKLAAGSYQFALNDDGTCCAFVLVDSNYFGNALFPATGDDTTTPIGAAEHAHEMTTKDISTFLFPNTFLYDGDPSQCCTVGYHSFDMEADAQGNFTKFYVMNYSSWVTPGLFGDSFSDITALSHELAETFNDPFVSFDGVHNQTQWWQTTWGLCQNNLEVGDVIEGLPVNVSHPVVVDGYTYHPQNEALLQWFAGESPSRAWNGAYSFPDPTVLTAPAPSLGVNCGGPIQ